MNKKVNELIAHANAYYEYETKHVDAADNYTVITNNHVEHYYGIDRPIANHVYFGNWYRLPKTEDDTFNETGWLTQDDVIQSWKHGDTLYVTIYLGQEEVEFCFSAMGMDVDLTTKEIEWINRNTDWICNDGTALYQSFPETWIVAEYAIEE